MPSRRRVLTTVGTAGAAGLAGCTALDESNYSPGTDSTAEWPMPAYDRGFSAYNPDAAAPREGVTLRWSTEVPSMVTARPVVAAERVLVPTATALVALDLTTGEERWRKGQDQPWTSAPAVHDGTAYVGFAVQPGLAALDVETGDQQWRVETSGFVKTAPTFDHGYDALYVGDETGGIYRIDPANGEIKLRGGVFGPVTTLAHSLSLLVGTESGEVYNLYLHQGEFTGLWRRKVDGKVTALTAGRGGPIFVATFGGPVYRLRGGAHVGTSQWEAEQGATHLAATDADVVGSDYGGLRTFDAGTGTTGWEREGHYDAAPAIAGDTVYVGGGEKGGNGNGFIVAYALSGGTGIGPLTVGGKRWRFDVDSAVMEGVAVADGAVFAITQGPKKSPSRVYALDAA